MALTKFNNSEQIDLESHLEQDELNGPYRSTNMVAFWRKPITIMVNWKVFYKEYYNNGRFWKKSSLLSKPQNGYYRYYDEMVMSRWNTNTRTARRSAAA